MKNVRDDAARALGDIYTPEAIMSLINMLGSSQGEEASRVLKKIEGSAVDSLIASLGSGHTAIKIEMAKRAGDMGDKKASEWLVGVLDKYSTENLDLLEEVVTALGKIRDTKAVEPLLKTLKPTPSSYDKDYKVQCLAIFALGDIGDSRAAKPLVRMLFESNEARIRWTAAFALGKIGDDKAVEALVKVVEDERDSLGVQCVAFRCLLKLDGDMGTVPILRYLKKHVNELVSPPDLPDDGST